MPVPDPLRVLDLFRSGLDTLDIARLAGVSEAVVWRLLDSGQALDAARRERGDD